MYNMPGKPFSATRCNSTVSTEFLALEVNLHTRPLRTWPRATPAVNSLGVISDIAEQRDRKVSFVPCCVTEGEVLRVRSILEVLYHLPRFYNGVNSETNNLGNCICYNFRINSEIKSIRL